MPDRKVVVTNDTAGQAKNIMICLSSMESRKFKIGGLFPNPRFYPGPKLAHLGPDRMPDGMNLPWKVFEKLVNSVWSLLLVTMPGEYEEADAWQLIDAAVHNGVSQIVLLSAAHGHTPVPSDPPTDLGFTTKLNIETSLKEQIVAQTSHRISWTILKPVAYYDSICHGAPGQAFLRSFQQLGPDVRVDFVAMEDVARAAARALEDPELYNGKSIVLAGDKLSFNEMNQIFKEEMGEDLLVGSGSSQGSRIPSSPSLEDFFDWLGTGGFRIHPSLIRSAHPGMISFRMWLGRKPPSKKKA